MSEGLATYVRAQLRAEMARREVTATQLAGRLNVSDMWVSRRLRGNTPIAIDELERIAQALDMPVSVLLERAA